MKGTLLVLFSMLFTLASHGADETVASASRGADDNSDMLYRYAYIEGVRQQDMGNYIAAMDIFQRCVRMKPDAAEANYALGNFYLVLQKDSLGMEYLKRAAEIEPSNTEFVDRLAQSYLMRNDIASATQVYEDLVKEHPDRTEYLDMLARIYEHQRDYKKLLSVFDRMEIQEGQSEELTLSKMQAYSYLDDQEGAYRELSALVKAHPHDLNIQVMMGNWLLSNGRKEEAHQTFLDVLKEEPDNAQGQMSLMDFYRVEGQYDTADSLLYDMLINPRTEPETRVSLIRSWVQGVNGEEGDSIRIMEMFNKVLALPQKTSEVAEMRVSYLSMMKAPADTLKAGWRQVLEISPEAVGARLHLIELMWHDSIDENVISECKKAVEYIPDEPALYYQLGMAQYLNKHIDDAIETLTRATHCITPETKKELAGNIYASLGDILQRVGRLKDTFAAYDSCLVYNPDNIMCLNNYAYFLSVENRDLKKAEQMSYRAITKEANNATYLDTYAWILYKQQRYEEACIYIEQALKNDTDSVSMSGEIRDHAGDIYYQLGRREEALKMWQEALPMDPDNVAVLRKKIKHKKLVIK